MYLSPKRLVLALWAATVAIGCSSSDENSQGGQAVPLDQVPGLFASTLCAQLQSCVGAQAELFMNGMDCVTRLTRQVQDGTFANIQQEIDKGTIVYHPEKVSACIAAIEAEGCDAFVSRLPDACEQAVEGKVALGGDCTMGPQCAGTAYCKMQQACPGKCSAREAEQGDCAQDEDCQSGLICDPEAQTCVRPATSGQACEYQSAPPCRLGFVCLGETPAQSKCYSLQELMTKTQGQDCDFSSGAWCQEDLSCVISSVSAGHAVTQCVPSVSSGAPCNWGFPDPCPTDEYCDADLNAGQWQGSCKKLPEDGQPCVGQDKDLCAAYYQCDLNQHTCKPIERLGGSCVGDSFCYSENCNQGTCAAGDQCQAP